MDELKVFDIKQDELAALQQAVPHGVWSEAGREP